MATARGLPATPTLSRISGFARIDRRTKRLVTLLQQGEIAVIDHADLDALAARSLADAHVSAVINAQPFISGRYPNRGPAVLKTANVPMFELADPAHLALLRDGAFVVIDESGCLYQNDVALSQMTFWSTELVEKNTLAARANLGNELERFARNTLQYLDADKDLLLDPTDVPSTPGVTISGRHALIVVRGENYKEDLGLLRPYIRDVKPVLIAVDGGADALLGIGQTPDIIIGDMDSVSDEALQSGALLIVHAYSRGAGDAPGMSRVTDLGLDALQFPVPGTSEDAALLLAYEHGADLIVALGTHSNLEDFLDKGRAGMASTFLVRLKVGSRLVDARGVFKLYQPKPPASAFFAIVLSAMFPIVVLMNKVPIIRNIWETTRLWWRLSLWHHHVH